MGLLTKCTFIVQVGIGLTNKVLLLTTCLVDTGAEPKKINGDYLKPQCKLCIERLELQKLSTARK